MIIIITAMCRGRQLLFHLGLVSFPLPGTPVYIQLLQVSFNRVFESQPWSNLIAFALA